MLNKLCMGRHGLSAAAALLLIATLGICDLPWAALASGAVVKIAQKNRAFAVSDVQVTPGTTLHFTNEDDFPHQIHVIGPSMNVDSPLQSSGQAIDFDFATAGAFEVRCGIHPRMRMSVHVQ